MNGSFISLRYLAMVFAILAPGAPDLSAQATLPAATALRSYDKGYREPVRLATDAASRLYVADPRLGAITIRDESGKFLAIKRGFDRPLGVAVDPSGRIFICEAGKGRVSIFTPGWVPAGALGQGDGEFQMPNHILITADGLVYVVDSTASLVKVYGPDGLLVRQFGGPGRLAGQLNFPTGVAVTPAGEIFVSDQGNERVQVFDASGTFLRKFGGTLGMMGTNTTYGRVQGLLADAQGRIYLADSFRGVVTVLTPAGVSLGAIGAFGAGPGHLAGPASLAMDSNNRLFVASPGNTRVEIYGLDTYTDPHILFANLIVSPTELQRSAGYVQSGGGGDDQELESESEDSGNQELAPAPEGGGGAARPENGKGKSKGSQSGRATQKGRPSAGSASGHRQMVAVLIKIPGVDPTTIQPGSITANGVPAARMPGAFIGDFDGGGLVEYRAWFDQNRLVATMPDGDAFLVLSGRLTDGRVFESIADMKVVTLTGSVQ